MKIKRRRKYSWNNLSLYFVGFAASCGTQASSPRSELIQCADVEHASWIGLSCPKLCKSHCHHVQDIAWSVLLVCRPFSARHFRDLQASEQDQSGTATICCVTGPALTQQCSNQLLHGYFRICSLTAHKGLPVVGFHTPTVL